MNDAILALASALIGGGIVAWVNYQFGLRQANIQKRKEIEVSHLISAYLAIEDYSLRNENSPKKAERVAAFERATAAIFLFGDEESIEHLHTLNRVMRETGELDVADLVFHLRDRLRSELGLAELENKKVIHFRGDGD